MIRFLTILICIFTLHTLSFGQSVDELVQTAYSLQISGKHDDASTVINKAISAKGGEKNKLAWHVRGFIYKDLFIKNRAQREAGQYRSEAVTSFLKSNELDKDNQLAPQNQKALRFLAVSYFNDASDIIAEHDPDRIEKAEDNYFKYRNIITELNPDTNLVNKDIEYFLAMSTAHRKIYESDRETYDENWNVSNEYMNKVLDLDPTSFKALYAKGVSYYNRGAYNIERMPHVEIYDLMEIQSESMRSIEAAFPFMMRAYEIDSTKVEAVRALKIITFNLNKEEESRYFQDKLEELDGNFKK